MLGRRGPRRAAEALIGSRGGMFLAALENNGRVELPKLQHSEVQLDDRIKVDRDDVATNDICATRNPTTDLKGENIPKYLPAYF